MIVKRRVVNDCDIESFLKELSLPKNLIKELINMGRITLKGEVVTLKTLLKKDDIFSFNLDEYDKNDIIPYKKEINVIYEDEEIILVKKDRGILIHSDGNSNDTLLNALSFYLTRQGCLNKARCLHRIDVETTGLVLFSKNIISYHYLNRQMEEEKIKKIYLAILEGNLSNNKGKIEYSIGSDRHHNNRYVVSKNGKKALTIYEVLNRKNNKTLVKVEIKTGRTHQIRVHFSYIKHPLVGDKIYGNGGNLMLHSYILGFNHPATYKYQEYKCDNKDFKL